MNFPYRLFLSNQVTPYVILFIERDGSTYLSSLLMAHPDIHAVYERFAVMKQKGAGAEDQIAWAERFLTPGLIGRWGALGFKTKLNDILDKERFGALLEEKNCRVIHMSRRNRVKAVISKINARRLYEASGKWNLYDEKDRMPPMVVELDELDQLLAQRQEAEADLAKYISELSLPTLKIVYEDLLVDRRGIVGQVLEFLGLRRQSLSERTLKHTSDDLRDVVQNFSELEQHFSNTEYRSMLRERLL